MPILLPVRLAAGLLLVCLVIQSRANSEPLSGVATEPDIKFLAACCDPPVNKEPEKAKTNRLPVVVEEPLPDECEDAAKKKERFTLKFAPDYDRGIVIRPIDPEKHPYELRVNGWVQFRHNAFSRDVQTWTDNAGVTRPVLNRHNFDVERARLIFSGYAVNPNLKYFVHLDGDTDGAETVDFFDCWWSYKFCDAFELQMGKRKVPGSRQWILGARRTRFADRPMANDFFRPDRTVGVFALGELAPQLHYEAMIGNGFNTVNRTAAELDDRFAGSGTMYWDPFGDYGQNLVDFEGSEELLARIGHSVTYSMNGGRNAAGAPFGEADFLRLSDGTRLTQIGALVPGVTVSDFNLCLYGIDVAGKWRGWSANAEYFLRWIDDIQGNAPIANDELYQHGFYAEGGRFLIPKRLDANLRYSVVNGEFGSSSEYAGGLNWYPFENEKVKVSFDVTVLDGSPLNNTGSDILVGDDGTLFRTQFQAEF